MLRPEGGQGAAAGQRAPATIAAQAQRYGAQIRRRNPLNLSFGG